MLDGWYCRSIANMQAEDRAAEARPADAAPDYSSDSSQSETEPEVNYRSQYMALKKKLKYLIYENECFQDALRMCQKRLLKASKDRTFLLDRLMQYEKPENSTSESDETESSDDQEPPKVETVKRKKVGDGSSSHQSAPAGPTMTTNKPTSAVKRKRPTVPKKFQQNNIQTHNVAAPKMSTTLGLSMGAGDGHMTPEEVERHLQSRQSFLELLPERAPPTVPTEMFSNDPSLDRYSEANDLLENSPHLVDEWIVE